jgi:putative tryptophan/tyrosine transport system substrate-binding protein
MRRREFIAGLGSAAAWAPVAQAQQSSQVRRIGMLVVAAENDSIQQVRTAAFWKLLEQLGWTEGRNLRIEYRFVDLAKPDQVRRSVVELVEFAPDVIVTNTGPSSSALQLATRAVPIVFAGANDPVGAGIIESFSRPGGNTTGFATAEFSTAGKYVELLKEMVPSLTSAIVLRDPNAIGGVGNFASVQASAGSLRMEVRPVDNRSAAAVELGITILAGTPNIGMIVPGSATSLRYRDLIIKLAARYKLPAVYSGSVYADDGGLLSYGPDMLTVWRGAASYVDPIFKGEKPSDLPVQLPAKYETAINMKTAKALGLIIPETLLATADKVIQ